MSNKMTKENKVNKLCVYIIYKLSRIRMWKKTSFSLFGSKLK